MRSGILHHSVEDFDQRIDDHLGQSLSGFNDLVVGHIASREREITALIDNNCAGALDGPRYEIAMICDLREAQEMSSSAIYRFV